MISPVHVAGLLVQALDADGEAISIDDWQLRGFELTERLSEPYSLQLDLASEDVDLAVAGLVGGRVAFTFGRDEFEREVRGIVLKADTIGVVRGRLHLRLWVAPSLELLGLSRRMRIFQGLTAVQIVQTLVGPAFEQYGGTIDTSAVDDLRLRVRDYCVQFDETDLQLAQRLLAEEGISFSFRHGGDAEELVLMPMSASLHSVSGEHDTTPRPVKLRSRHHDNAPEETVRNLEGSARVRASQTEVSMWNFKDASPLVVRERHQPFAGDEGRSLARFGEVYEHETYRPVEEEEGSPLYEQLAREVAMLAHAARLDDVRASGLGNVVGFTDGGTFELLEHPTRDLDGSYALLSVSHHAEFDDFDGVALSDQRGSYDNRFTCIRVASADGDNPRTYVPPRRRKPRAPGPVTAIVVGPEGEEIHTDHLGRVKVRMHWDREGAARGDHETSCWVPVSQIWAGPGFGAVFIPRVGMEVVVSFIAADPDRPLCTGVVYNGGNLPPYSLPDGKTRSVIKTSSSPGGDGFNELSFEDAAGREEVFLHAQKNLREVVKAAHTTSIGGPQTLSVAKDRTKAIEGNESCSVGKDQLTRIEGSRSTTIVGSEATYIAAGAAKGEGAELVTAGRSDLRVDGTRYVWARDEIVFEVGAEAATSTKIKVSPKGIKIEAVGSFEVDIGGKTNLFLNKEGMAQVSKALELYSEAAEILLVDTARVTSKNAVHVGVHDKGSIDVDGDVATKGAKVSVEASAQATIEGREVSIGATGKKVAIDGAAGVSVDSPANIAITAGAEASLRGMVVRGN